MVGKVLWQSTVVSADVFYALLLQSGVLYCRGTSHSDAGSVGNQYMCQHRHAPGTSCVQRIQYQSHSEL